MSKTNIELSVEIISTMIEIDYYKKYESITSFNAKDQISNDLNYILTNFNEYNDNMDQESKELAVKMVKSIIKKWKFLESDNSDDNHILSMTNVYSLISDYHTIIKDTK